MASSEHEVERLTERLEKQLAAEGRSVNGPSTRREVPVEWVNVPININGVTWLRATAKMALGLMSLSQPDEWLDTPSARRLIGWLWDETPVDEDREPAFLLPRPPDQQEAELFVPPAHYILQQPISDGRVGVAFNLFGFFGVGLTVEVLEPVADACWVMAPGNPCREVTIAKLAEELAERRIREQRID